MEYINGTFEPGAEADQTSVSDRLGAGRREATAQYGKDYCAAVGSLDMNWNHQHPMALSPPFWRQISNWKQDHLHQTGFGSTPQRFAKILVTTGIYEGETILFPLIAGKNEDAIRQLLVKKWESRCFLSPAPLPSPPIVLPPALQIIDPVAERDIDALPCVAPRAGFCSCLSRGSSSCRCIGGA